MSARLSPAQMTLLRRAVNAGQWGISERGLRTAEVLVRHGLLKHDGESTSVFAAASFTITDAGKEFYAKATGQADQGSER